MISGVTCPYIKTIRHMSGINNRSKIQRGGEKHQRNPTEVNINLATIKYLTSQSNYIVIILHWDKSRN
jgi:hypothetical protein